MRCQLFGLRRKFTDLCLSPQLPLLLACVQRGLSRIASASATMPHPPSSASTEIMIKTLTRPLLAALLTCALVSPVWSTEGPANAPNALGADIARTDANVGWREVAAGRLGNAEYAEYLLTS